MFYGPNEKFGIFKICISIVGNGCNGLPAVFRSVFQTSLLSPESHWMLHKGRKLAPKHINKTSPSFWREPSLVQRPRQTPPPHSCWLLTVGLRHKRGSGVVIVDYYRLVVVLLGTAEHSWPSGLHRWVPCRRSCLLFTASPSSMVGRSLQRRHKGFIQFQSEYEDTSKWNQTNLIRIILLNIWSGR